MVYLHGNDVPSMNIFLGVLGVVVIFCLFVGLVYCCMYSEAMCMPIGLRSARNSFATNNSSVNAHMYVRTADRFT